MAVSLLCPHRTKGARGLPGVSFIQAPTPLLGSQPPDLTTSQRPPLLMPSPLTPGWQHGGLTGTQTFRPPALSSLRPVQSALQNSCGPDRMRFSHNQMATQQVKKSAESQRGSVYHPGQLRWPQDGLRWSLVKRGATQSKVRDSSWREPVEQADKASGLLTH